VVPYCGNAEETLDEMKSKAPLFSSYTRWFWSVDFGFIRAMIMLSQLRLIGYVGGNKNVDLNRGYLDSNFNVSFDVIILLHMNRLHFRGFFRVVSEFPIADFLAFHPN
jgi:hypothetical protein